MTSIVRDKSHKRTLALLTLGAWLLIILSGCGREQSPGVLSDTTATTQQRPGTTTETAPSTTTTTENMEPSTTSTTESATTGSTIDDTGIPSPPEQVESTATPPRTLKAGLRGEDVTHLQERLIALGYSPGAADGVFSSQTSHAVLAFQKVNGLARDGVAGPKTLAAFDDPVTLTARYSGDHIEVSKVHQVLLVVKGGKVERIINASTGGKGYTTPSVKSSVDWKAGKYYESKKYGGIMVWSSFFYGGVAVHGYGSVPAYPASHGCVRIPIPDSKYVYDNMAVGSMVYAY